MRGARIALWAAAVMVTAQVIVAPTPTSTSFRRDVVEHGARTVVDAMWAAGNWDQEKDAAASGSPAWIELPSLLSAGTNVGASEGPGSPLVRELPKMP